MSEYILIADDDVLHLEALADLLELEGFQTLRASHPDDALELYARHAGHIAVAMVDLHMPGMGGAGLVRELVRKGQPPVIFLLTGACDIVPRACIPLESIRRVLRKPFDIRWMLSLADSAVSQWRALERGAA